MKSARKVVRYRALIFGVSATLIANFWVAKGHSEVVEYRYDPLGRLVETNYLGARYFTQVAAPLDIALWEGSNATHEPAGMLSGYPARKFTLPEGASFATTGYRSDTIQAGESASFRFTLLAVNGSASEQSFGIGGGVSGWGATGNSSARIVSGPGQISHNYGGFWRVSGLSTSEPTRIEVIRTFTQSETFTSRVFIDQPGGNRTFQQLIVGAPLVTRQSPSQGVVVCYDDAGNRISYSTGPDQTTIC